MLKHAASVTLIVLAVLFSGLEVAIPFLHGLLPIGQGTFALLAVLVTGAAFVARLVAQKTLAPSTEPKWENGDPE